MIIRLSLVHKIDGRAIFPLAALIHSYLQTNPQIKTIEIGDKDISFSKGFFSSKDRIKYLPYQIVCRDRVIYYEGEREPDIVKDKLFALLVNVLYQLRPGYICKI